jgi:diguanylate cyclase (GGDEF)-like protein/PAS domain S-box-containing protein
LIVAQLSLSAGLFESALTEAADAVFVTRPVDGNMTIVFVNRAFTRLTGFEPADVVGEPVSLLHGPRTDAEETERFRAGLSRGERVHADRAYYRHDGSWFLAEVEVAPVNDDEGHYVAAIRDVTARRSNAAELARSNELLSLATTNGGVGIWEYDRSARRLRLDATLRRFLDLPIEGEIEPDAILTRILPEDVAAVARFLEDRQSTETPFRVRTPNDELRYLVARGIHEITSADGVTTLAGVVINVTASHLAAELVIETLESITDAYFTLDRAWLFCYANQRCEELLQRSRAELLGSNVWDLFPGAGALRFGEMYRKVMDGGSPSTFEEFYEPLCTWFEVRVFPVAQGIAVYFRDVTSRVAADAERRQLYEEALVARTDAEHARERIAHRASHDDLTELSNRQAVLDRLDGSLQAGSSTTVLFIDLDRFKLINDCFGHAAGDRVLTTMAGRLRQSVRPDDLVARLGGDEFVIAVEDDADNASALLAERVLHSVREPFDVCGQRLVLSASIGIAHSTPDTSPEDLIRNADVALYRAKDAGRDRMAWFDEHARTAVLHRLEMETDLRTALRTNQLRLAYQPSFDLVTHEPRHVEGLLRWHHPVRGDLSPATFIPVAEDSGLIVPIGTWVNQRAIEFSGTLTATHPAITTWVNLSVRQIVPGLAEQLLDRIAAAGLAPRRFGVEITESVLADLTLVGSELKALRAAGIQIAIDDFGTGYSSLARLRSFPVDIIKLDQSFVRDLTDPSCRAMVAAVIELAHALHAAVIAEGIETPHELQIITDLACDYGSGFLLSHPVAPQDLSTALRHGRDVLASARRLGRTPTRW